jgi:Domain of unknown function (DUF5615)
MFAYYMDVHVPSSITAALRRRGIDVITSQEDGTRNSSDVELLARATQLNRVLFTQDFDLLRIASQWQKEGSAFAGVVFAHQQGIGIGQCIQDLELLSKCASADELRIQVVYLPL